MAEAWQWRKGGNDELLSRIQYWVRRLMIVTPQVASAHNHKRRLLRQPQAAPAPQTLAQVTADPPVHNHGVDPGSTAVR